MTEIAESEPPKAQSAMRLGANAACPFDPSAPGSRAKKTMSISFTMLCESIAIIVGVAKRKTTPYGLVFVPVCSVITAFVATLMRDTLLLAGLVTHRLVPSKAARAGWVPTVTVATAAVAML